MPREGKKLLVDKGKGIATSDDVQAHCGALLRTLMSHKHAHVFTNEPVDAEEPMGVTELFDDFMRPMDLGTIEKKLEAQQYSSISEFADDVRLTFTFAKAFNEPDTEVYGMAKAVGNLFEEEWKKLEDKLPDVQRTRTMEEMLASTDTSDPTPSKLEAGHSKEDHTELKWSCRRKRSQRKMTSGEKLMLAANLQKLPPGDHLLQIADIIVEKKAYIAETYSDNSLEFAIDACEDSVLWDIDRIVRRVREERETHGQGGDRDDPHILDKATSIDAENES